MRKLLVSSSVNNFLTSKVNKEEKESLLLLIYLLSKGDPTFFYYDQEYHKSSKDEPLLKKLSINFPEERLFIRYGLAGICVYQCKKHNILFPKNPYQEEDNLKTALEVLKSINKKTVEEKVMKYLMPYKSRDVKLLNTLKSLKEEGITLGDRIT